MISVGLPARRARGPKTAPKGTGNHEKLTLVERRHVRGSTSGFRQRRPEEGRVTRVSNELTASKEVRQP